MEPDTIKSRLRKKLTFPRGLMGGLVIGLVLGVGGLLFFQTYNPPDVDNNSVTLDAGMVFSRIVERNELVSASQNYNITDKAPDTNKLFDLIDIPFTENSFWYRYTGTIKAGIDLSTAEYSLDQDSKVITITLDEPCVVSNTPDMDASGVLEENNNILNPIHVENVDAFQRECIKKSEQDALEGGLLDEAKANAETNIRDMFYAALGGDYTVEFTYR